jgi:hypothetical protein
MCAIYMSVVTAYEMGMQFMSTEQYAILILPIDSSSTSEVNKLCELLLASLNLKAVNRFIHGDDHEPT